VIPRPRFLFLETAGGCVDRCTHCARWQRKRPASLELETVGELCRQFADLAPGGVVVTCGGEPSREPARWADVIRLAREAGLRVYSVTGGGALPEVLPDVLTVSVEGLEATHDRARGQAGACARALGTIRAAADRGGEVVAMTILARRVLGELQELEAAVLGAGARRLKLNVIQPQFAPVNPAAAARWFGEELPEPVAVAAAIGGMRQRFSPRWTAAVLSYLTDLRGQEGLGFRARTSEALCNSWCRNLMVDAAGGVSLCFSGDFPRLRAPLGEVWERAHRQASWVGAMARCRAPCGISHSVRAFTARTGEPTA
jgi:pyruvate-formate lyase-activating enzyme